MPLPALLPLALAAGGGAALTSLFGKSGETPARNEQIQRFTPQQQSALNSLLQQGLQGIKPQNFGSQFEPIARQARSQFNQQTVPSLAERFTSMGQNSLSSPAFASQLGQAGAGLEEGLAAQKAGFGLQQQSLMQNLLGLGLQPQFESLYHQRQPGFLESAAPGALQALLMYLSGGASAAIPAAASAASALGSLDQNKATGLGGTPVYQSGFANPALWSPGMQNVLRPF